jgi:hypothetical protein
LEGAVLQSISPPNSNGGRSPSAIYHPVRTPREKVRLVIIFTGRKPVRRGKSHTAFIDALLDRGAVLGMFAS